ncbi:MAG: hypothetical protein ABL927_08665 [Bdellovibrionales bacterium]
MNTFLKAAICLFSLTIGLSQFIHADELIYSKSELKQLGYKKVSIHTQPIRHFMSTDNNNLLEEKLIWPIQFQDESHSLGNNMSQFQNYGGSQSYFHGGCDLRTKQNAPIYAPISGKVEAFYYSYNQRDDGSLEKFKKPNGGDPHYFEVSIITPDGHRFEIHHIDPNTLTPELASSLKSNDPHVTQNQLLGNVVYWPVSGVDGQNYHHIHFNMIAPDGTILNPEAYEPLINDTIAPHIEKVFAKTTQSKQAIVLTSGQSLPAGTTELLVLGWDQKNNSVYTQAPSKVALLFQNGANSIWDFTRHLNLNNGQFPNIHNVFADQVKANDGNTYQTKGNYEENQFIYRLVVPADASGPFQIHLGDAAGNDTTF